MVSVRIGRSRISLLIISAALIAVFAIQTPAAKAAGLTTLRVGQTAGEGEIGRLGFAIAERNHYFEREGLRVEVVPYPVQASRTPLDALYAVMDGVQKGDTDIARTGSSFLVQHVQKNGSDLVVVATALRNPVWIFLARPEIKGFSDLKGRAVAVTVPDDGITLAARKLLELHGLKQSDVGLREISMSTARLECLTSNQCAAAPITLWRAIPMLSQGYKPLGTTNEVGSLEAEVYVANRKWAAAHRGAVTGFVRATAAGLRYMQDPKNRDEITRLAMEATKQPEAAVKTMLGYYWDPKFDVLPKQGEIDVAGVGRVIDLLGEYGRVSKPYPPAAKFVDTSYAKDAKIQ